MRSRVRYGAAVILVTSVSRIVCSIVVVVGLGFPCLCADCGAVYRIEDLFFSIDDDYDDENGVGDEALSPLHWMWFCCYTAAV